jgi:hypothetical protein
MLVVKVFLSSAYFDGPEADSFQSIGFLPEMNVQLRQNLVGVKGILLRKVMTILCSISIRTSVQRLLTFSRRLYEAELVT